jgi:hypothetical protein
MQNKFAMLQQLLDLCDQNLDRLQLLLLLFSGMQQTLDYLQFRQHRQHRHRALHHFLLVVRPTELRHPEFVALQRN